MTGGEKSLLSSLSISIFFPLLDFDSLLTSYCLSATGIPSGYNNLMSAGASAPDNFSDESGTLLPMKEREGGGTTCTRGADLTARSQVRREGDRGDQVAVRRNSLDFEHNG